MKREDGRAREGLLWYAVMRVYIALGANLPSRAGEPAATLRAALEELGKFGTFSRVSRFYRTMPVGVMGQPEFVNAVASLDVANRYAPGKLLEQLMKIERAFGRERTLEQAQGPRTLDLDLLLYGDYVLGTAQLTIPHPRMHERAFVLMPLHEIAPALRLPTSGRSVEELLSESGAQRASVLALGD